MKCVVVGFDKHFNYSKLVRASSYLQQPDCHFIATNIDSGLPMGNARVMPGNALNTSTVFDHITAHTHITVSTEEDMHKSRLTSLCGDNLSFPLNMPNAI